MGNMFLDADKVFAKVESKRFITEVMEVQMDIELRATLPVHLSVKEMSVMVQHGKSYDSNRFVSDSLEFLDEKKHEVTELGLKKESQTELHDSSTTMTVNLMSLARNNDDNNRSLSVWTSLVCDHPLNASVRVMASASPSSPQHHSVVQVCYRLSPDLQPGAIHNNLDRDTDTMTTFVLQNLGAMMRKTILGMEIIYRNTSSKS